MCTFKCNETGLDVYGSCATLMLLTCCAQGAHRVLSSWVEATPSLSASLSLRWEGECGI